MGVRKYNSTFRAYLVDKNGKAHQEYFNTEEEAQAFYDKYNARKKHNININKNSAAKYKDLPVGLHETFETYLPIGGGENIIPLIKGTVSINGKIKHKQASYGNKRTREEAIKICFDWRNKELEK